MGIEGDVVSTEFQKLRQKKDFTKAEIKQIKFSHAKYEQADVDEAYQNADYEQVIEIFMVNRERADAGQALGR